MECANCKNLYSEKDHIPRMLIQCGHTICEMCIKQLFTGKGITCPECKMVNEANSHTTFPKNVALLNMTREASNARTNPNTTNKTQLTDNNNNNDNKRVSRNHNAQVKGSSSSSSSNGSVHSKRDRAACPNHGKRIEAYCEDCLLLLCIDCILLDGHNSHQISNVQKVLFYFRFFYGVF
jgi:hypothetical protein